MRFSTILMAGAFALAACSGDSSSTQPPTDTTPQPIYSVALDSGIVDSTNAEAGSVIPVRVRVSLAGSAVNGLSVAWTIQSGHGALSTATSTSDSLGRASVLWTLGDTAGLNSLTAVAGDASVTLRKVGIAGGPSAVVRVTADSSVVVAGATVPITARVTDRHGNPVPGIGVEWTASGGALSVTSTTSSSTGDADTNFTAPTAPGLYTITATLPGRASVTFLVLAM